jgi:hypothetical protein
VLGEEVDSLSSVAGGSESADGSSSAEVQATRTSSTTRSEVAACWFRILIYDARRLWQVPLTTSVLVRGACRLDGTSDLSSGPCGHPSALQKYG